MNIAEAWGQCSCERVIIFDTLMFWYTLFWYNRHIVSFLRLKPCKRKLNRISSALANSCGHRENVNHVICRALYYLTLKLWHIIWLPSLLQWPHEVEFYHTSCTICDIVSHNEACSTWPYISRAMTELKAVIY